MISLPFFIESLRSLQSFGYNFVHSFSPSFRDLESLSGHVANLLSKLLHSKWFWLSYSEVSLRCIYNNHYTLLNLINKLIISFVSSVQIDEYLTIEIKKIHILMNYCIYVEYNILHVE